MELKFTNDDSEKLNDDGYIVCEAPDVPPLLLATKAYLQVIANAFAAGHGVTFGGETIYGNPDHSQCPDCVKEKKLTKNQ